MKPGLRLLGPQVLALLAAGLVLDGSGFLRRSHTIAGNLAEPGTLATMQAALPGSRCMASCRCRWRPSRCA